MIIHRAKISFLTAAFCALVTTVPNAGYTEQQVSPESDEESFTAENAILDTSILFAIGAHEARQELRGAFGWPTFQEGLVEGVYFRFDPDGYARFSPTPRLDTDVFEVICRPRTHTCMGRKGPLQLTLTNRGLVQLEIEGVNETHSFALVDGIEELPLPRTILAPLDVRTETLLGSKGELLVRHGQDEVSKTSLAGFPAVTTYLRWVAARQDYQVMPRGWPIPNSKNDPQGSSLTKVQSWNSPMPQPARPNAVQSELPGVQTEVAEVRGELNVLRQLLIDRQAGSDANLAPTAIPDNDTTQARIQQLQEMADALTLEISRLRDQGPPLQSSSTTDNLQIPNATPAPVLQTDASQDGGDANRVARQLEYLMTEIGLAPDVALMVVQQGTAGGLTNSESLESGDQNQVLEEILEELKTQITPSEPSTAQNENAASTSDEEFQLLSDYFKSVIGTQ